MSSRSKARIAGVFYILEGAASAFGAIFVVNKLVVSANAAATARNILAHESLLRWGFAVALIAVVCHLVYTVLFYDLFKPVNKTVSLLAAFFSLVAIALQAGSNLFEYAPLLILRGGVNVSAFHADQVKALALLFLKLNLQAFNIYLVIFGFWLILIGYLIFRSAFMPHVVGILVMLAGLSYLTLLAPPLANALSPYYLAPDAVGEPVPFLWLLFVGVNPQRWTEQARAAGVSVGT